MPDDTQPHVVLVFGSTALLSAGHAVRDIRRAWPRAIVVGCSTAGEIAATSVRDDTVTVTTIELAHSTARLARARIESMDMSRTAGRELAQALPHDGLVHVLVLSDGLNVNGSELVAGLNSALPEGVVVTGGLAADGERFTETVVLDGAELATRTVVAVGFYGDRLRIGHGSMGGWDAFGPVRRVTRATANVVYELDSRSALSLYKEYLGPHADGLPATGLLYPLSLVRDPSDPRPGVVRTLLGVDEVAESLTFAGDVPEGGFVRLMKANFNRLIDGAAGAASAALQATDADLALLVSCVGRRMLLKQRAEDELEAVREMLGPKPALTGFYSYGEICPFVPSARCELHNQTMTITSFAEV